MNTMKTCTKCGIEKALDEFCKNTKGKYGHASVCKLCKNAYEKSKYKPRITGFIGPLREGYRACTKCLTDKALGEFNKSKSGKYGVTSWCKECVNAYGEAYKRRKRGSKLKGFIGPLREGYKACTKCLADKALGEFGKDARTSDGLARRCKSCLHIISTVYYASNTEARKDYWYEYSSANKEKVASRKKIYNINNRDIIYKYSQSPKGRYSTYKSTAKSRGRLFSLTEEEFMQYWQLPCQYCGDEIETIGLDRIDNKKGYTMDNVTPCCKICNLMKRNQSVEEFVSKCAQVVAKMG